MFIYIRRRRSFGSKIRSLRMTGWVAVIYLNTKNETLRRFQIRSSGWHTPTVIPKCVFCTQVLKESQYFNHFGVKQTFLSVIFVFIHIWVWRTLDEETLRRWDECSSGWLVAWDPSVVEKTLPQDDCGDGHSEPPNFHSRMYLSGIQINFLNSMDFHFHGNNSVSGFPLPREWRRKLLEWRLHCYSQCAVLAHSY